MLSGGRQLFQSGTCTIIRVLECELRALALDRSSEKAHPVVEVAGAVVAQMVCGAVVPALMPWSAAFLHTCVSIISESVDEQCEGPYWSL